MKKCIECHEEKLLSDFVPNKNTCKLCRSVYLKRWNDANKDKSKQYTDKRNDRVRQMMIEYRSKPCCDCGNSFHYSAMEFDHVPERGPKLYKISSLWNATRERRETELAKCDLVCANCHNYRTWLRQATS